MAALLRRMRENPRVTAYVCAVALLLPVLFVQRFAIPLRYVLPDHSGRATLSFRFLYLIPVITGALSLVLAPETFRRVLRMRYALVGIACLMADVAVYAIAGVLERSFKAALILPLTASASVGALLTGIAVFKAAPAAIDLLVATATTASAAVGGFQMAEALGYKTLVGSWIVHWDQAAARMTGTTIAWRRAEGFALNPNVYTPFAVIGFAWVIFGRPKGFSRWLILASSSAIALLGQSRTTLAVILALLVIALLRIASDKFSHASNRRMLLVLGITFVLLAAGVMAGRSTDLRSSYPTRALNATRTFLADPVSDDSLTTRTIAWDTAVHAIAKNPWGWFQRSASQMKPFKHPHNEFLFRLLYAGPLWLLVHLIFLVWLWAWLTPKSMRWIGAAIATIFLLNGIPEPIIWLHSYTVLLYVIVGCAMWAKAAETTPATVA